MFPVWAQIKHRKYHLMRSFWKPVNSGKEVKFIFNFTCFFTTNDIIWGLEESFFFFNIIELACWFVQFFYEPLIDLFRYFSILGPPSLRIECLKLFFFLFGYINKRISDRQNISML